MNFLGGFKMEHHTKVNFESDMVDLLGLPKGTIWFELRCAFDEIPTIKCQYEVWDKDRTRTIVDGEIATLKKKYEVVLKEIKEE